MPSRPAVVSVGCPHTRNGATSTEIQFESVPVPESADSNETQADNFLIDDASHNLDQSENGGDHALGLWQSPFYSTFTT